MKHQHTEIREAAAALLKKRFRRVYGGRWIAPAQADLPCVVVFIDGRDSRVFNDAPLEVEHRCRLTTMVCVQANDDADALAEEMLALVERLFYANPTLRREIDGQVINALASDLLPESLNINHEDNGEYVTAFYQQSWQAVYYESPSDYVGGDAQYYPQTQIGAEIGKGGSLLENWQIYGSNEEIDATDLIPKGQNHD